MVIACTEYPIENTLQLDMEMFANTNILSSESTANEYTESNPPIFEQQTILIIVICIPTALLSILPCCYYVINRSKATTTNVPFSQRPALPVYNNSNHLNQNATNISKRSVKNKKIILNNLQPNSIIETEIRDINTLDMAIDVPQDCILPSDVESDFNLISEVIEDDAITPR